MIWAEPCASWASTWPSCAESPMKHDWKGKVVLITGASSGIGRALPLELGRRGARLGLTARRGEELLRLSEEIESAGGEALALPADVRDPAAMNEVATK